ncbi:MAG: transposase [Burkholderiaceae bacterium]
MARPGPRTTSKYSERFKATAVKLSHLPNVGVKDVAESLCIHPFMLSKWRKQAREGLIMTKGIDLDKDVAAELKELRRIKKEYERLKLEHDLLKKAIEFTSTQRAKSLPSSRPTEKISR